jgi:hypothetical protein
LPNKLLQAAASRIVRETRSHLSEDIRRQSGRTLYTPVSTLFGSKIYFLGIYPGFVSGDQQWHNTCTIEKDLDRLETLRICKHAYLEEKWGDAEPGQAKLQRRALHLFSILAGSELAGRGLLLDTSASNLILLRNIEANEELLKSSKSLVEKFWRHFHQAVIDISKPEMVLIHGVRVAKELAQILDLGKGKCWPSGYGAQPRLYAWQLSVGRMLLAIPNLGRYDPGGQREQALRRFFHDAVPHVIGG